MTSMKGRGYNLNMKLTEAEHTTYRKALHFTEARSMSAFIRECIAQRLVALGFEIPDPGTLRAETLPVPVLLRPRS